MKFFDKNSLMPSAMPATAVSLDLTKYMDAVRGSLFGGTLSQPQVDGQEGILRAFATHGDGDLTTTAYALATAYHETAKRMVPVRESLASTDDQAIRRIEHWAKKTNRTSRIYWRRQPPYNHAYFGRGHVQLTWKSNYAASSDDAGVDLVKNPNAMLDPEISARVLIKGLLDGRWNGRGHGLRYYLDRNDVKNARRTVNGLDRAERVAGHYRKFLAALTGAMT